MGIIAGYVLFFVWLVWPMIRIFRSPYTSGFRKASWAIGTFLPFLVAVIITKLIQILAPTEPWASEIFNSTAGAFILVMAFLVGGWVVLAIYDAIHKKT